MGILPLKKRVNRDKCSFATKQRMFGVFAIDEILRYRGTRFPGSRTLCHPDMENSQNADTALLSFFETVLRKCDNHLLRLSPRVLHIIVDAEAGAGALVYLVEEAAVGLDLVLRGACVTYFQVSPLVEQGNCF